MKTLSYKDRCARSGLTSMERTRLYRDLEFCFKILKGHVSGSPSDYGLVASNNLRGNALKLHKPAARVNVQNTFFAHRVIPLWNSLSNDVVLTSSFYLFKKRIRACDLNNFYALFDTLYMEFPSYRSSKFFGY